MGFNSKYTGLEVENKLDAIDGKQAIIDDLDTIREGASKGSTSVQPSSLANVATSGSYNDLSDKPTIPSAVTESTVSAWGFTKNTGTYSKPTTGIPKTDLASDVQASLGKADTALQSYTEQYTGTITEVKVNNTSIATEGVANIPTATTGRYGVTRLANEVVSVSTSHAATSYAVKTAYDLAASKQDALVSGTNIKTINGASILGEGDLTIESNNGSAVVVHDASETEVELTPNVIHRWDGATSLLLTVPEDPDGMVYSYKAVFVVASSVFSLSLPYNLRWVNSTMPVFEYGRQYEISIEGGRVLWAMFDEPAIEGEELPWIENDGTDYILTDYYPDENDVRQSVKFAVLRTLTHHQCIVGTSESSTLPTTKIAIWALSNNGNILQYFDAASTTLSSSTTVGQVYEFSGESTAATKLNASRPLTVFNLNSSSGVTSTNAAHARFYYFRLYDASGKVTLDLRPFKRTSDGAIGVLDAVSGTFYPSVNGNLTEGA